MSKVREFPYRPRLDDAVIYLSFGVVEEIKTYKHRQSLRKHPAIQPVTSTPTPQQSPPVWCKSNTELNLEYYTLLRHVQTINKLVDQIRSSLKSRNLTPKLLISIASL